MMKLLLISLITLLSLQGLSQGYDRVTIGRFNRGSDKPLIDTLKKFLNNNRYAEFISDEVELYGRSNNSNEFASLKKTLKKIETNGTDDISQCFIPRHTVNYYKGGNIVRYVLICFECDGLRFSEDFRLTRVKSTKKREEQIENLKSVFKIKGLVD